MNIPDAPENGRKSLLCLYYPQQLLPALAAVLSFRRSQGEGVAAPLTVFVWAPPATEQSVRKKRLQAFKVLLEGFEWACLYFLEQDEIKTCLSQNVKVLNKAAYLRNKFGQDAFNAIYYAHDISADFIAQSAMQAFPNAKRICFGDALGVVYSNDFFTSITYPIGSVGDILRRPIRIFGNMLYRLKRAWTLPPPSCRMDANYVIPIMPCDPGGDFLKGKELLLVDGDSLRHVQDSLSKAVEQHLTDEKCWANGDMKIDFIMLLGSYSESRLTTEGQECALYVEVARSHVAPGSRIVLKPHPAASDEKVERIRQALSTEYDVEIFPYGELPIEAMPKLVMHSKVLSFSYSSVSLRYLYDSAVFHVMDDAVIQKFFPIGTRQWMLESNQLYLDQLTIARQLRNKQLDILKCQK